MRERSRDLEGRRTLAPLETAIVLLRARVDGDPFEWLTLSEFDHELSPERQTD
jgi:hypothetical protein